MYLTGNQKAIFHMVPDTEKSAVRRSHAGNGFLAENTTVGLLVFRMILFKFVRYNPLDMEVSRIRTSDLYE